MGLLGKRRGKKCNLCRRRDRLPGKTVCGWCLKNRMPGGK